MFSYLLRRLAVSAFLLWGVVTITFALIHIAPGDPIDLMLDPSIPDEDQETLRARFGLDDPWPVQYARWISSVAQGDLGISLRRQRPVIDVIADALPHTLRLTSLALLVEFGLGTLLGLVAAVRRGTWADQTTTLVSLALYSMPVFWLALMAQMIFSAKLGWFPTGGTGGYEFAFSNPATWLGGSWRHLVLPVLVLGVSSAAGIARFVRGSVLEVLAQDYVRTAHGKGLAPSTVLSRHVLRNAAIPLVTLAGLHLPLLFNGAVVTETIFSWPGMGRVVIDAIFGRDYPVIMATTLFSGALVIAGSFLADLGYAWVDPRIRVR